MATFNFSAQLTYASRYRWSNGTACLHPIDSISCHAVPEYGESYFRLLRHFVEVDREEVKSKETLSWRNISTDGFLLEHKTLNTHTESHFLQKASDEMNVASQKQDFSQLTELSFIVDQSKAWCTSRKKEKVYFPEQTAPEMLSINLITS